MPFRPGQLNARQKQSGQIKECQTKSDQVIKCQTKQIWECQVNVMQSQLDYM